MRPQHEFRQQVSLYLCARGVGLLYFGYDCQGKGWDVGDVEDGRVCHVPTENLKSIIVFKYEKNMVKSTQVVHAQWKL
jgi:hypothetical protein